MEVEIKNFKCIEDKAIEFVVDGPSLLSGVSGSGKTTILESIVWCLYGGRGVKPLDKKTCVTTVKIIYGNLIISRSSPGILSCKDTKLGRKFVDEDAQSYIDSIFYSEEVFRCTSYIEQKSLGHFLGLTNKEKYNLLSKICFYNSESIFELIRKCNDHVKEYQSKYDTNITVYNELRKQCSSYSTEEWDDLDFDNTEDETELQNSYDNAIKNNHQLEEWKVRCQKTKDAQKELDSIVLYNENAESIYHFMLPNLQKITEYKKILGDIDKKDFNLAIKEYEHLVENQRTKKLCSDLGIKNVDEYNNIPENYLKLIEDKENENRLYGLLLKKVVLDDKINSIKIPDDWDEKLEALKSQKLAYKEKLKYGAIEQKIRAIEEYDRNAEIYEKNMNRYKEYVSNLSKYQTELKEIEGSQAKNKSEISSLNVQIRSINETLGSNIYKTILDKCLVKYVDDETQSVSRSSRSGLSNVISLSTEREEILSNLKSLLSSSTKTYCIECKKKIKSDGTASENDFEYKDVDCVLTIYDRYVKLSDRKDEVEESSISLGSRKEALDKPSVVSKPEYLQVVDKSILSELKRYQHVTEPDSREIERLSKGYELKVLKDNLKSLENKIQALYNENGFGYGIEVYTDYDEKTLNKLIRVNEEVISKYKKYGSLKESIKDIKFHRLNYSEETIRRYHEIQSKLDNYKVYQDYMDFNFKLIEEDYRKICRIRKLKEVLSNDIGKEPPFTDVNSLKKRLDVARKTRQYRAIKEKYDELLERKSDLKRKVNKYHEKSEKYIAVRSAITTFTVERLSECINVFSENINNILRRILPTISVDISSKVSSNDMGNQLSFNIIDCNGNKITTHKNLSGGEQNRLSLAIAMGLNILVNGKILMTDEVFSSVEDKLKEDCLEMLKEELKDKVLIDVTHGVCEGFYENCIKI